MKTVYDLIVAVRKESSSKKKLELLKANKDNADLQYFLQVTYEPRLNFYIRAVEPKFASAHNSLINPMEDSIEFNKMLMINITQKIAGRDITGHAAKNYIANIHRAFANDWERELLELMIQRDAKCGISKGTINKAWPGLVTAIPYMRCSLAKDLPSNKALNTWPWERGVYSQIKADGMYSNINHAVGDVVTIESRAGSPFPTKSPQFAELLKDVKQYIPAGYQAQGEMLIFRNGHMMDRAAGNGVFNSVLQGGELEIGDRIVFQVWDLIPIAEAKAKNTYKVRYEDRFEALTQLLKDAPKNAAIRLIEYKMVYSIKEAYDHCRDVMVRGLEGTVIKHPDTFWEDGTSQGQVKLKLEFVIELKMVDLNAADKKSKNANMFGSIQGESACGKLKVGVAGIKDDVRKEIHDNWATYKNGIMAVRCNGVMLPDAERGGFFSLFLPRLVELRLDKDKADDLVRILEIQQDAIDNAHLLGLPSEILTDGE